MAQMRRGSLELCILAILSGGKRYGYDIVQELAGGDALVIKEGTIYPLLNRLKSEGLVTAEWQPSPEGPARKYYTLTAEGSQRMAEMGAEWRRFAEDVERVLRGSAASEPGVSAASSPGGSAAMNPEAAASNPGGVEA
jgi:PadR family transcriptional regulator PadR